MNNEGQHKRMCAAINADPLIQSLLYDLNLLPEQTTGDPKHSAYTQTVVEHMLMQKTEQRPDEFHCPHCHDGKRIAELGVQVKQADERGDEAMRRAHVAENEIESLKERDAMDEVAIKHAHRLAMLLECVVQSTPSGTQFWDEAMATLEGYRSEMNAIHERESPTFMGEPSIPPKPDSYQSLNDERFSL